MAVRLCRIKNECEEIGVANFGLGDLYGIEDVELADQQLERREIVVNDQLLECSEILAFLRGANRRISTGKLIELSQACGVFNSNRGNQFYDAANHPCISLGVPVGRCVNRCWKYCQAAGAA